MGRTLHLLGSRGWSRNLVVGALVCIYEAAPLAAAAPVPTPAPTQPQPFTVELVYQEAPAPIWSSLLGVAAPEHLREGHPGTESAAKGKERPPLRGFLKLTRNPTNQMAFIWDWASRRLSLDLNRNGDLADDPQGVLTAAFPAASSEYCSQEFTNALVTCSDSFGNYQMRLDLTLRRSPPSGELGVGARVRSFYGGLVESGSQKWEVRIIFGTVEKHEIRLRPWEAKRAADPADKQWMDRFLLERPLFLQDTLWQLALASAPTERSDRLRLELKPRPVELGKLKLTGQYIERLVLHGTNNALLCRPDTIVSVPTGEYKDHRVRLRKGTTRGWSSLGESLTVTPQRAALIDRGGPLTNWASVQRSGGYLVMEHEIRGSGGLAYGVADENAGISAPSFAIYRAGKPIGKGAFHCAGFG